MNSHEHESHECFCPSSGYTVVVEGEIPCNSLTCPEDGSPMRALETGAFRSTPQQGNLQLDRRVSGLSDTSKGLVAFGLVALGAFVVGSLFVSARKG